jgi:hypothetical protein
MQQGIFFHCKATPCSCPFLNCTATHALCTLRTVRPQRQLFTSQSKRGKQKARSPLPSMGADVRSCICFFARNHVLLHY